jgi:hypothetical protein
MASYGAQGPGPLQMAPLTPGGPGSPTSAKFALGDERKRSATAVDLAYPHKTLPNFQEVRGLGWAGGLAPDPALLLPGTPLAPPASRRRPAQHRWQAADALAPCPPADAPAGPAAPQDLASRPPPPLPPLDPSKGDAKGERFSARTIVQKRTNWLAVLLFLAYCAATMYYIIIRSTRTLETGVNWWAAIAAPVHRLWHFYGGNAMLGYWLRGLRRRS